MRRFTPLPRATRRAATGCDRRHRGHHILTVLEPDMLQARSIKIFTTTQSAVSDVEFLSSRPVTQLT